MEDVDPEMYELATQRAVSRLNNLLKNHDNPFLQNWDDLAENAQKKEIEKELEKLKREAEGL
jgi:hypothetical protein